MFFPYVRIVPMHLMVLAGGHFAGSGGFALLLFLLLKTAADVATHVIGHTMSRAASRRAQGHLPVAGPGG